MDFNLDEFTGPLSLLLELVKEEKVDILEVNLYKIIDKYLLVIDFYKKNNLSLASDYLLMASELLLIKSRKLLPVEEELVEEELEELRDRLIDYSKLRDAVLYLDNKLKDRDKIIIKEEENTSFRPRLKDMNLKINDLYHILETFIKEEKEIEVSINNKLNVKESLVKIKEILKEKDYLNFSNFIMNKPRNEVVANFLAILTLSSENYLHLNQNQNFGEIICEVK